MVSCKQCNTHNSLDSAFCKKCRATIDPAELALATDRLTAMIADGNRLFADGRTEDALMVAGTICVITITLAWMRGPKPVTAAMSVAQELRD